MSFFIHPFCFSIQMMNNGYLHILFRFRWHWLSHLSIQYISSSLWIHFVMVIWMPEKETELYAYTHTHTHTNKHTQAHTFVKTLPWNWRMHVMTERLWIFGTCECQNGPKNRTKWIMSHFHPHFSIDHLIQWHS